MRSKSISFISLAFVVLWSVQAPGAEEKTEGRRLYLTYCSGCHGESGKGNGPAASSLPAKPANHTDGKVMNQLPDKELMEIISKGGAAAGKSPIMPSWGAQLKEKQVKEIISYIRSLAVPPYKPAGK